MTKNEGAQLIVKPSADRLAAAAVAAAGGPAGARRRPPVHLWNPPFCGDLDIRIARDGTWFYLGTPIGRQPLVDLFASILKREGDRFYLVTPVEKVGIRVDDAPLFALDMEVAGMGETQVLTFQTRTGDSAACDPDHALRVTFDPATREPAPYIHVRDGLEARIDRKTFYRLVDLAVTRNEDGRDWFGVWSSGHFFPISRAEDLL
jgi:uncharacterized protein